MLAAKSMERGIKGLQTTASPKAQGNRTGSKHESPAKCEHVFPIQEHYIRSAHVYNCFPKGQPIRKPIASSRRSRSSAENFHNALVLIDQRLPLYTERTMHLYMPRLTFNHTAATSINTRSTNCSFVTNNKLNMKKKGLNINHLYSFKQSKRGINDSKMLPEKLNAPVSKSASPIVKTNDFSINSDTLSTPRGISSISHFDSSRQSVTGSPMYVRLMRELEREAKIPGHIRADGSTSKNLGKVLTRTHIESLLMQEKPVIPPAFYMKPPW